MSRKFVSFATLTVVAGVALIALAAQPAAQPKGKPATKPAAKPEDAAVARARKTVAMLDDVYKQVVVLITDKYVNSDKDFAAGSAAVLLFENLSKSEDQKVRLLDATGEPYDPENVAKDAFEKEGIKRLRAGEKTYEQVVEKDGKRYLRVVTPVPVVMDKCIMCHDHYADAKKKGEVIGAIAYTVPVE